MEEDLRDLEMLLRFAIRVVRRVTTGLGAVPEPEEEEDVQEVPMPGMVVGKLKRLFYSVPILYKAFRLPLIPNMKLYLPLCRRKDDGHTWYRRDRGSNGTRDHRERRRRRGRRRC